MSTSAAGDGQYNHTYSYGPVGNIATLAGRTYVYDTTRTMAARYSYVLGGEDGRFDILANSKAKSAECYVLGAEGPRHRRYQHPALSTFQATSHAARR